jgi:hypothetical protein
MDGEGDEDDPLDAGAPPKKKARKDVVCTHCGLTGHVRRTSKACLQYVGSKTNGGRATQAVLIPDTGALDPAEDMLNFDSLPLREEPVDSDDAEVAITTVRFITTDPDLCDSDGEDIYNAANRTI